MRELYSFVRDKRLHELQRKSKKEIDMANELANHLSKREFILNLPWDMEQTHKPHKMPNLDWGNKRLDDMEWVWCLNRHRFYIWLGRAYQLCEDDKLKEKYLLTFREQILHWIDNMKFCEANKMTGWRTIETGLRAGYWIEAISYFYEDLDEEFIIKFKESLLVHAQYLVDTDTAFSNLSNWGILEAQGLFKIGLFLEIEDFVLLARDRVQKRINYQVNSDGDLWEQSPMYHNEVLLCLLDMLALANELFSDEFKEKVFKMSRFNLWWKKPDGTQFLQSDSDAFDLRQVLMLSAYVFKNGILKFGVGDFYDLELGWHYSFEAIKEYEKIEVEEPKYNSVFSLDGGNAYLRSSWAKDANLLNFTNGPIGTAHGSSDKLHINLIVAGEDVLVDSGRYTYVEKDIRYKLKSAHMHNTFVLDDKDFSTIGGSWSFKALPTPINARHYSDDKYDYVEGAHLGYMDKGTFVRRKVIFIKPNIYIISDEIYGTKDKNYKAFYHFHPDANISLSKGEINVKGERAHTRFVMLGESSLREEESVYSPFYNLLLDNKKVVNEQKFNKNDARTTIIICGNNQKSVINSEVEELEITGYKRQLLTKGIIPQAFRIKRDNYSYVVYMTHEETWSSENLYSVDGHYVRGSLCIIDEINKDIKVLNS